MNHSPYYVVIIVVNISATIVLRTARMISQFVQTVKKRRIMKTWNRPIRCYYFRDKMWCSEEGTMRLNPWKEDWGVTNWIVGTCRTPLSPWIQISLGRITIQIKWYVVIGLAIIGSFIGGLLI